MWRRLFQLAIGAYTRSPSRSWVITTAATVLYRMAQRTLGRREVTEVLSIKPGEMVIIEQLSVTHAEQIKDEKRRRKLRRRKSRAAADSE